MKHRISAVLIMSLMLSILLLPPAVSAEYGKSIIIGMVQAPADYSVGLIPDNYGILDLWGRYVPAYWDVYDRIVVYLPNWVFLRILP